VQLFGNGIYRYVYASVALSAATAGAVWVLGL
jgi:hypothetical protein